MTEPRYATATLEGRVLQVWLDRPDRLNAVSDELYADLEAVLGDALVHPEVGALLLRGRGRAFCAGADLKAHAEHERTPAERRAYVWAGQRVCRMLQQMPQPVVCAVHGYAIGAGAEIALSADVVVCADDAEIRFPEVGLGTFVGGAVTYRLPRLVGQMRAKELLLLGRSLSGAEAASWGLVTRAVAAGELEQAALEVARSLADQPAQSTRLMKQALNQAAPSADAAFGWEAEALLACMGTEDWTSGVQAFGRQPRQGGPVRRDGKEGR